MKRIAAWLAAGCVCAGATMGQRIVDGAVNPDYGFGLHAWIWLSGPAGAAEDDSGEVFGYYSVGVHVHVNYGVYDGTYLTTAEYHHVIPPATRFLLAQQQ